MTARDRRALLIGAGVVAGALLVLRMLPWGVRELTASHAELRERTTLLARARDELGHAPLLRDSAATLTRAVVALAPKLLDGGTSAVAGADLAARLNLAASRAPARLEEVTTVADSGAAGRLRRASVRVTLETDVRGLASLLRELEFGDAALTIDRLEVTSPDPGSADARIEVLRVQITVAGWFLGRREG